MNKLVKTLWLLVAVTIAAGPLFAQDSANLQREAQDKLLAYRAARADGIRKLAERIKGLMISSETTVRDFVTESDVIQTELNAFLSGVRETDKRYMEDGTCEVDMEVTLRTVVATLKQMHNRHYKGNKVKASDFDQIIVNSEDKVIKETGMGAPPPSMQQSDLIPNSGGGTVSISKLSPAAKDFWMAQCTPQGRLMAERGARVEAMRRLAERIRGVHIDSQTTVRDFVAESDQINVDMRAFLRGAREVGVRYHEDELMVEVEMEVTLRSVYASLKTWAETHYKGDKKHVKQLEELVVTTEDKVISETGMAVPPEKYLRDAPEDIQQTTSLAQNTPDWINTTIRETGYAAVDTNNPNAAQAKLMAYRAAELDARRKLGEEISGLRISSDTTVQDFVATSDRIRSDMLAFQQGVHVVDGSQRISDEGMAETVVELELRPLWDMVIYYHRNR
ncbi:MAG: hypothetical protein ACOC9S_04685 [Planctomycetota bacterium]